MKFFTTDEYLDIIDEGWDDIDSDSLDDEENIETNDQSWDFIINNFGNNMNAAFTQVCNITCDTWDFQYSVDVDNEKSFAFYNKIHPVVVAFIVDDEDNTKLKCVVEGIKYLKDFKSQYDDTIVRVSPRLHPNTNRLSWSYLEPPMQVLRNGYNWLDDINGGGIEMEIDEYLKKNKIEEAWDDIDSDALDDEEGVPIMDKEDIREARKEMTEYLMGKFTYVNGGSFLMKRRPGGSYSSGLFPTIIIREVDNRYEVIPEGFVFYITFFRDNQDEIKITRAGGDDTGYYTEFVNLDYDAFKESPLTVVGTIKDTMITLLNKQINEESIWGKKDKDVKISWDKIDHNELNDEENMDLGHKILTVEEKVNIRAGLGMALSGKKHNFRFYDGDELFKFKQIRSGYTSNLYPGLACWRLDNENGRRINNWKYKITVFYDGMLQLKIVKTRRDRKEILEEIIVPYEPVFNVKNRHRVDLNYFYNCVLVGLDTIRDNTDNIKTKRRNEDTF